MKKLIVTILASGLLILTASTAFATTTPYVCPNGNTACVQNGSCLADGTCQYPEGCPNGGVPKRDGTGHRTGGGQGRGAGHCGGRNR